MKNRIFKLAAFVILAGIVFTISAFRSTSTFTQEKAPAKTAFEIPEDVNKILDKSCFGCHNVDAQSEDARDALLIDKLSDLKTHKLVAKLDEIASVVQDGDMPPSKFLKKYPEKTLTADESKKLSEWALQAAENLMK
jgi:mono/diheme cytochrome c family protein